MDLDNNILIQKYKFKKRFFTLVEDGVVFQEKKLIYRAKYKVPYEHIPNEPVIFKIGFQ